MGVAERNPSAIRPTKGNERRTILVFEEAQRAASNDCHGIHPVDRRYKNNQSPERVTENNLAVGAYRSQLTRLPRTFGVSHTSITEILLVGELLGRRHQEHRVHRMKSVGAASRERQSAIRPTKAARDEPSSSSKRPNGLPVTIAMGFIPWTEDTRTTRALKG